MDDKEKRCIASFLAVFRAPLGPFETFFRGGSGMGVTPKTWHGNVPTITSWSMASRDNLPLFTSLKSRLD